MWPSSAGSSVSSSDDSQRFVSRKVRVRITDVAGSARARAARSPSCAAVAASEPVIAPNTVTTAGRSGSGGTVTSSWAAISSGAPGAQACQASIRAAARSTGHVTWKAVASRAGRVAKRSEVTTPGVPRPPP